jgi:hypothetical protein
MTEQEWLAYTDPREMLEALRAGGLLSERKARLFAVACGRRIWHLRPDELSRRLVEAMERYADGAATDEELDAALAWFEVAECDCGSGHNDAAYDRTAGVISQVARDLGEPHNAWEAAWWASDHASAAAAALAVNAPAWRTGRAAERAAQADLVRCVFGSILFRPLPPVAPAVLAWSGGTVARLAAGIYQERDFSPERLAVLADALEEAGCDQADVLAHLRGPGPHVRGCWAVDLLLGKS